MRQAGVLSDLISGLCSVSKLISRSSPHTSFRQSRCKSQINSRGRCRGAHLLEGENYIRRVVRHLSLPVGVEQGRARAEDLSAAEAKDEAAGSGSLQRKPRGVGHDCGGRTGAARDSRDPNRPDLRSIKAVDQEVHALAADGAGNRSAFETGIPYGVDGAGERRLAAGSVERTLG